MEHKLQVKDDHYNFKYERKLKRWISYFYQIKKIINHSKKKSKILEIGIGSKFVYNRLKEMGYNITSADFDERLNPDVVADITDLPFEDNEFDLVCAFEVLEHLPFSEFEVALNEMKRVSKKHVLFSVPYSAFKFHLSFKFLPFFPIKTFEIHIPYLIKHKFNGEHYWEAGKKNYPVKKIKRNINCSEKTLFFPYSSQFFLPL